MNAINRVLSKVIFLRKKFFNTFDPPPKVCQKPPKLEYFIVCFCSAISCLHNAPKIIGPSAVRPYQIGPKLMQTLVSLLFYSAKKGEKRGFAIFLARFDKDARQMGQ